MKVKCPISHVTYKTADLIGGSFISPHPILSASITFSQLKKTYLARWAGGLLDPIDTHLLGTALILKLPIEGKIEMPQVSPANFLPFWQSNLEKLARTVEYLEGREFKHLPRLRISEESLKSLGANLTALMDAARSIWTPISEEARRRNAKLATDKTILLAELNSAVISGRVSGGENAYDSVHEKDSVDELLMRGLKGSPLSKTEQRRFPSLISEWAASVGDFPTAMVTLLNGKKVSIRQHWQGIIEQAFQKDALVSIISSDVTTGDVIELLEHCYSEVPTGTLHASELFKKLEVLREVLEEFRISEAPPKIAEYKGSETDLLAALGGADDCDSQVSIKVTPGQENLTAAQRLAIRMATLKSKK